MLITLRINLYNQLEKEKVSRHKQKQAAGLKQSEEVLNHFLRPGESQAGSGQFAAASAKKHEP